MAHQCTFWTFSRARLKVFSFHWYTAPSVPQLTMKASLADQARLLTLPLWPLQGALQAMSHLTAHLNMPSSQLGLLCMHYQSC